MREKGPLRKKNVLSVRITDGEMEQFQELMGTARMSASELIREALLTYASSRGGKDRSGARRGGCDEGVFPSQPLV